MNYQKLEYMLSTNGTIKFLKISPGAYIFQSLFEGLIFGEGYIRRGFKSTEGNLRFKIDWPNLIAENYCFCFVLLCI